MALLISNLKEPSFNAERKFIVAKSTKISNEQRFCLWFEGLVETL